MLVTWLENLLIDLNISEALRAAIESHQPAAAQRVDSPDHWCRSRSASALYAFRSTRPTQREGRCPGTS